MLQLIGWMGCLYMIARGFEMFAHAPTLPDGKRDPMAVIPAVMLVLAGLVFILLLNAQADAAPSLPSY